MEAEKQKGKTARGSKFGITMLTVALGILIFWLLGFAVDDLGSLKGPDYETIEAAHLDKALADRKATLDRQIGELDRSIAGKREEQRLARESADNLQRTIGQLLEIEKLALQNKNAPQEADKAKLSASLSRFLESQGSYQSYNEAISQLTAKKTGLEDSRRMLDETLSKQKDAARKEYCQLCDSHRMKLALFQLALLVPLAALAGFLLLRLRESMYFPLIVAFSAATILQTGLVVHIYFPSRFFKYILLFVLVAVAVRCLVWLIKMEKFPKREWLLRQRRAAYERFLCPVCAYPIRTGPRKYLYWTARTVQKIIPRGDYSGKEEESYSCPSCGTKVFEPCPSCGKIRHSLLDHCQHCGATCLPEESK